MTNPTHYNQLRQILTDRLPHLKKLSFGCEVRKEEQITSHYAVKKYKTLPLCEECVVLEDGTDFAIADLVIIGHPPTLQDVLLAITQKETGVETRLFLDIGELEIEHIIKEIVITYDLTKNLADQSDKTLLAIIQLLR